MPAQPAEMFGHQEWGEQSLQTNPVGLIAYTAQFRGTKDVVEKAKQKMGVANVRDRVNSWVEAPPNIRYAVFV